MLKTHAVLEVEKNGKVYQLHLPADAPLGEVYDTLFQMRCYVMDRIQEHMKSEMAVKEQKVESPKVE